MVGMRMERFLSFRLIALALMDQTGLHFKVMLIIEREEGGGLIVKQSTSGGWWQLVWKAW